jgi:hypothetical protein
VQFNLIKTRFILFGTTHAQNKPVDITVNKQQDRHQAFESGAPYCTEMVKKQQNSHQYSAQQ